MSKFQFPNKIQLTKFKKLKLFATWCSVLGICLMLGAWHLIMPVKAQSPEATPTANEGVEEIREAAKEIAREKIEAAKAGQKRAFVGKLAEIFNSTLVLGTRLGERRAQIATDAAIISAGKEIKFDSLEIGSSLICMGYLRPDEILDTRRVVAEKEEKALPERTIVFGEIADIDEKEKIISVKQLKDGTVWQIEITSKTELTKKVEGAIEEADFADISLGDRLVAIGATVEGEEKTIAATLIYNFTGFTEKLEEASPTPTETPEE
jgi:hypothetical protein